MINPKIISDMHGTVKNRPLNMRMCANLRKIDDIASVSISVGPPTCRTTSQNKQVVKVNVHITLDNNTDYSLGF